MWLNLIIAGAIALVLTIVVGQIDAMLRPSVRPDHEMTVVLFVLLTVLIYGVVATWPLLLLIFPLRFLLSH